MGHKAECGQSLPPIETIDPPPGHEGAPIVPEPQWAHVLAHAATAEHPGVVGLYNQGNTCYANAVLQCLTRIALLRSAFLTETHGGAAKSSGHETPAATPSLPAARGVGFALESNGGAKGSFLHAFTRLIRAVQSAEHASALTPTEILRASSSLPPREQREGVPPWAAPRPVVGSHTSEGCAVGARGPGG